MAQHNKVFLLLFVHKKKPSFAEPIVARDLENFRRVCVTSADGAALDLPG
jgi:hypothetical protein